MQIKKIYLDLQEAKKEEKFWKDVRTLESEAFKEPLTLQIEYDPSDLKRLEDTKNEVNVRIEEMQRILDNEQEYISNLQKENKLLKEQLLLQEQETEKLKNEISEKDKEKDKVLSIAKEQESKLNSHDIEIEAVEKKLTDINKKITKEPKVFTDTGFVSGQGQSYLWMYDIPSWDYILITNIKVTEKNEYAVAEDEFKIERIHITDGYAMPYELRGTDGISIPTATLAYILAFIPY